MEEHAQWTREDFLTYVLFYAASLDKPMSEEEHEHIINTIGDEGFEELHQDFSSKERGQHEADILAYCHGEDFDSEYAQIIKQDVMDLFMSEGELARLERPLSRALVRISNL